MAKRTEEKTDSNDFVAKILAQSLKVDKELTKYASRLSESNYGNIDEYIDTGSYALNRLITGSIYKGIPRGRVVSFCGEPSCGKSYLCGQIIKNAQISGYTVVVYDSESAIDSDFLTRIGCDTSKIVRYSIDYMEQFKNHVINTYKPLLDEHPEQKILIVLDSYGNLSCAKDINDIEAGKENSDFGTRAKAGKSMLRECTRFCGKYKIPLIFTNHVYKDTASAPNPMYAKKVQSGGQQPTYMSSAVVFMSKKANKNDDKKVIGNFLSCTSEKNRLAPEKKTVEMYLSFKTGPNKYYGLLEMAVEAGLATEVNSKTIILPHVSDKGLKIFDIYGKLREQVFTKEFLDKLDDYCVKNYTYSSATEKELFEEELGGEADE